MTIAILSMLLQWIAWSAQMPVAVLGLLSILGAAACVTSCGVVAIAPLAELVTDANHLASCDFSHTVAVGKSGRIGQLQRAMMQMSVNLRTVVSDVRAELDQLEIAVEEIADGNQDFSSRTESQGSSLEQTAASME